MVSPSRNKVLSASISPIRAEYLTSKESGGPWPSKNATRDGQVALVWATAQNLSVHGAKMTNFRPTHSKKRTLFKMKEMPPFSLHKIIFPQANIGEFY